MRRPLHKDASNSPQERPANGNAGLWFDKFCNQWTVQHSTWSMAGNPDKDSEGPKLKWINTVTTKKGERGLGAADKINEFAIRSARMTRQRGGRYCVFTSDTRFVTGLGRSHPVENGFAWHPTLGTPCLPGSSIKGTVRAWMETASDPAIPDNAVQRLLGGPGNMGGVCFLDAVPTKPVKLESDVMTPHYTGWSESDPPGDWRSPEPVPFLATAPETSLLFCLIPCGAVTDNDLETVMSSLCSALSWSGSGAKTAVGYGRFRKDDERTVALTQQIREQNRERERAAKLAKMGPIERKIEEILQKRPNKEEQDFVAIIQEVKQGRWQGQDKVYVAKWLESRMKAAKDWKETSAKPPDKDKSHARTLLVMGWRNESREP